MKTYYVEMMAVIVQMLLVCATIIAVWNGNRQMKKQLRFTEKQTLLSKFIEASAEYLGALNNIYADVSNVYMGRKRYDNELRTQLWGIVNYKLEEIYFLLDVTIKTEEELYTMLRYMFSDPEKYIIPEVMKIQLDQVRIDLKKFIDYKRREL